MVEAPPVPVVGDAVLKKLLKARSGSTMGDRRDMALLRVFLDTGCRLTKVTDLHQGDVDLGHQIMTVHGKGNQLRVVTYGAKIATALDRYLRQLEREDPDAIGEDRPLWVGRQGFGCLPPDHQRPAPHVCRCRRVALALAPVPPHLRPRLDGERRQRGRPHGTGGVEVPGDVRPLAASAKVERAHAVSRRSSLGDTV
jgi:integrase